MYQYQFLPPHQLPLWPGQNEIHQTHIDCLFAYHAALWTAYFVKTCSIYQFTFSRAGFYAKKSESQDLDFLVWWWTSSSPSSFSLLSSSLSTRISLFGGASPQLPTPPPHSVSTQLFSSYLIIWRAHSILSAWWRFLSFSCFLMMAINSWCFLFLV